MGLLEDESQTVKTRHPFCLVLWLIFMNRLPIPKKGRPTSLVFSLTLPPSSWLPLTFPWGIPQIFVEEKKIETRRDKEGDTRALTERDRRQRLDEIRELERSERSDRRGERRNWKRGSTER